MGLETYRKKRHFAKTPEPAGTPDKAEGDLYVIQKHAATRLHYDFRIELDGVLLSWAVPKGPSLDPKDRHLAVRVEDHPIEYGSFEGTIPKGEYGGGTVELWDRGTWEAEGDPREGLRRGDLKFTLHGEKLKGSWVLARMKRRSEEEGKEDWLLIKHRDEYATDGDGREILEARPESVASGRTVEQIASGESVWHSDKAVSEQTEVRPAEEFSVDPSGLPGARKTSEMPRFLEPELCTLVKAAPEGDSWVHEIKFDGYRALATIAGDHVTMWSRRDKDWTSQFKTVADELAKLGVKQAMLDGEVCVLAGNGVTSFQELVLDLGSHRQDRLVYYTFDIIHLNGYDLTAVPLVQRKQLLKRLLSRFGDSGRVRYAEDVVGGGPEFYKQGCAYGLEGIVSKLSSSRYQPGARGREWLKTKCTLSQEFVIVGWSDPGGSRIGFGALALGVNDADGRLRYVGKVGTGFNDKLLRTLGERLRTMEVPEPSVERGAERAPKDLHWVTPQLVGEVSFAEWTRDGGIRHPSFQGLREDKTPREVVPEKPQNPPAAESDSDVAGRGARTAEEPSSLASPPAAAAEASSAPSTARRGKPASPSPNRRTSSRTPTAPSQLGEGKGKEDAPSTVLGVKLTHPDRVFWPEGGVTKRELVEYVEWIAPQMMPYVLHRPVSMVRCPGGVRGVTTDFHEHEGPSPCFFHKHAGPDFPGPFERVQIEETGGPATYLTITEPGSVVALAQMGVLEIHIWGCTWPDVEHPDMMVFDLDPAEDVEWRQLADGVRLVRDVLRGLGLESFVKTTGGKGLHVVVPLKPKEDWDGVKLFAKAVADAIARFQPDRYVSTMSKAKRVGKVYVDYLRNSRTATFIAPYSTRAKLHPTVSVPLRWDELGGKVRPDSFTIRNLRQRVSRLKSDPWEGFFDVDQTITDKMNKEMGLG